MTINYKNFYFLYCRIINSIKPVSLYILFLYSTFLSGNNLSDHKSIWFTENKSQYNSNVKYYSRFKGLDLFVESDKFTYKYYNEEDISQLMGHPMNGEPREKSHPYYDKVRYHVFQANFVNANPYVSLYSEDQSEFYYNYILGNDASKWANYVYSYKKVFYQNLWENIDMHLYTAGSSMKYDYIVKPGADVSRIKVKYDGADRINVDNGNVYIVTSLGTVIEQKPYAFQIINGNKIEVDCEYVLVNNVLSFYFKNGYNPDVELVIDPTLIVSTFSGSTADSWGTCATNDNSGNIFLVGTTIGAGYPTTVGAYDVTYNGGSPGSIHPSDISISKFNSTGTTLLYGTYLGGSYNERVHSIICNSAGDLYLYAHTASTDFPMLGGSYDATFNGGTYDIVVARISSNGSTLQGSTYMGGSADDGVNITASYTTYGSSTSLKFNYGDDSRGEIDLDASGNVYVASCTMSSDFPTVAATGQPYDFTYNGGQDAVVFKFNSALSICSFSTYLGGSADDCAYSLRLNSNNSLYIAGGTTSTDFPTTAGVVKQTKPGADVDGFVCYLNNTGKNLLASTYLGTTDYDQAYFVEVDKFNDVYVFGQTMGAWPVSGGVYSNAGAKQFIQKLGPNLNSTTWSTVFGSTGATYPNISPTAFMVDTCLNIYAAGWGRCSYWSSGFTYQAATGMPITANAIQSATDGCDFYFIQLTRNATSLGYGTYYGASNGSGDHVDGGTSRFNPDGTLYEAFCAGCGAGSFTNFPSTAGAYSTTNNSSNCNAAVIKLKFDLPVVQAVASTGGNSTGCVPHTVNFTNTSVYATQYTWNFGNGATSTAATPSYTYNTPGTYTVWLTAVDPLGCKLRDSVSMVVTVLPQPTVTLPADQVFCNGTPISVSLNAGPGYTYNWNTGATTQTITATSAGTYSVVVSNGYCTASDAIVISTSTITNPNLGPDVFVCGGTPISSVFNAGAGYTTYSWSTSATTQTITATTSGSYTVTVTNAIGCTATDVVVVSTAPVLTVSTTPTNVNCFGQSTGSSTSTSGGGTPGYTYSWNNGQTSSTLTNVPAGSYTIYITDTKGCTANAPVTITQPAAALTSSATPTNVTCNGLSNGSISSNASGGTTSYIYSWNNGQTTTTATGLAPGNYTVYITDSKGCTSTANATITQPAVLSLTPSSTGTSCGGTTGTASVSPSGGTSPYNYSWNNSQTTATATGLAGGTYTVWVTDNNGCSQNTSATVSGGPAPLSSIPASTNVSCFGGSNGTATSSVVGGTSPYGYSWSNGQTNSNASNLTSGTYTLYVTDFNGCTSQVSVTITEPPQLTTATVSSDVLCFGAATGGAGVSGGGGTPGYSYSWSSGQTTALITNITAGTYTVTTTDVNSCTKQDIVIVNQPTQLSATVTSNNVICNGGSTGSALIAGSGGTPGYSFSWSNNSTAATISNLPAGSYTIILTDANGCSVQSTVSITEPPALTLSLLTAPPSCNTSTGVINALPSGGTPGYSYVWNTGGTTQTLTNLPNGNYSVVVTDNFGCTVSSSTTLQGTNVPSVTLSPVTNVSCFGGANGSATSIVTGGASPYSYSWNTGATTAVVTNLTVGAYTVTVTDNNGCTAQTTANISQPTAVSSTTSGTNLNCFGASNGTATVNVSGGTPGYTYFWVPQGGTSNTATGLPAGQYIVIVTDAAGCAIRDTVDVFQPSQIVLNIAGFPTSCFNGSDGQAVVIPSGGTGPTYTYFWAPVSGSTASLNNIPAGNYTVVVTDANGCTSTSSALVTQPPPINIQITTTGSLCNQPNGSASASASGGTPNFIYSWNNGQTSATATGLSPGTYTVTATDTKGCTNTATATVTSPNAITTTLTGNNVSCNGGANGSIFTSFSGGVGPFTYSWNNGLTTQNISNLTAGTYTLIITDSQGCSHVDTVTIVQPPLIILSATNATICSGATATVTASASGGMGNFAYAWLPGNATTTSISVTPATTTTYTVSVFDANGCTALQTATVTVNPLPIPLFSISDSAGCNPICITYTSNTVGSVQCFWSFGDNTTSNNCTEQKCYTNPGTYTATLTVTDNNGCSASLASPTSVTVYGNPTACFNLSSTTISATNPVVNITDCSNGAVSWQWLYSDNGIDSTQNPSHTFTDTGYYCITQIVTNQFGCKDTTNDCVYIKPAFTFFAPNTFTPNGDGLNDGWSPVGIGIDEENYHLMIFDRWGMLIFETRTWGEKWNGHANGGKEIAQIDTYVWKVIVYDIFGYRHSFIGHVNIIK